MVNWIGKKVVAKKKITPIIAKTIGQSICRDSSISLRTLETKLSNKGYQVSRMAISRHLLGLDYKKKLPKATPMLTENHKWKRVEWTQNHLNDDWSKIIFTDETAFQLFHNMVECWYKRKWPTHQILKKLSKNIGLRWLFYKRQNQPFFFASQEQWTQKYYVEILGNHIPEIHKMMTVSAGQRS